MLHTRDTSLAVYVRQHGSRRRASLMRDVTSWFLEVRVGRTCRAVITTPDELRGTSTSTVAPSGVQLPRRSQRRGVHSSATMPRGRLLRRRAWTVSRDVRRHPLDVVVASLADTDAVFADCRVTASPILSSRKSAFSTCSLRRSCATHDRCRRSQVVHLGLIADRRTLFGDAHTRVFRRHHAYSPGYLRLNADELGR